MPSSITWAGYGPIQITDPKVLQFLATSIDNKTDVEVIPDTLSGGVDPAFGTQKYAVVYYRTEAGGPLLCKGAVDFNSLLFSK